MASDLSTVAAGSPQVSIPDPYTARGITFLASGQQCTMGLPVGTYADLGECSVNYTDLGRLTIGKAHQLVNVATGERWYVGVNVAEWLRREHAAKGGAE